MWLKPALLPALLADNSDADAAVYSLEQENLLFLIKYECWSLANTLYSVIQKSQLPPSLLEADDILTGVLGPDDGDVEGGRRAEGGLHTEESRLPAGNKNHDNSIFGNESSFFACSE